MTESILIAMLTLGVGAWVGGFVTVFVVSRSSGASLGPAERVSLFRSLGRKYAVVASVAMGLILVPALVLTILRPANTLAVVTLVVALAIVAASVPAVMQARRMGRLRRASLDNPDDTGKADTVRRGARSAAVLRSALGLGSIALVVLAIALAAQN